LRAAAELWNDPAYAGGGHAITVYDGDFDENGKLTHVYINDTGSGQQGRRMPIDDFMNAANASRLLKNTFLTHRDSGLNPVRIRYVSGLDPSF
jgi:hypothetical protein